MKNFIRFLFIYSVIILSIFSFYFNSASQHQADLEITKKELTGVEYLKQIHTLSLHLALYQGELQFKSAPAEIFKAKENVEKSILNTFALQKKHPEFRNYELDKQLKRIQKGEMHPDEFYQFLDYINLENYRIGDLSKLLFEKDRKIYFLSALITHYMPEYLISTHIIHNIAEEFKALGSVSETKKNLYIEQKTLVYLSTEEVAGIIGLLQAYDDTQKLSTLIRDLSHNLDILPQYTKALSQWEKDDKELAQYFTVAHKVLDLSYKLNNEYMRIIESTLNARATLLEEKIFSSRLMLIFIIVLITSITFYFYRVTIANLKKDTELKNSNAILDKLVIFSKTDKNGHITHVSSALEKLSGFTSSELIGNTHRLFRHEDVPASTFTDLWNTVLRKEVWIRELPNKRKDGSSYWVKMTITPDLDVKGDISGFIAYRENITDKKELEIEKIKTQEALEFKSKFLSNMSHEIRTPLTGIIGLTYIALKTNLDKRQKDLMSKIQSSSNILLGVINDILDISKIESGNMTIEQAHFNLKELVENIENMLSVKASEQNTRLSVDYANMKHFNFIGDSLRITQVLSNLLSNAIKFTSEGSVILRLKDLGDGQLLFEVIDTGIGLKEEQKELLFNEFTQADMSTSRKFGGTGLGLAISKSLVELMGGQIDVESTFGMGSTFRFQLPLTKSHEPKLSKEEPQKNLENEVNALKERQILVAEDNKMNQLFLQMLLEESHLKLDFAENGKIALDKYQANSYDLILMDIQMPTMNGYEATQAIRKLDTKVPIIALSANVMKEDIQRSLDAGMNEHLAKPIEVEKLYAVILKYLLK